MISETEDAKDDKPDLLHGAPAIAKHLGLAVRVVYHLHDQSLIPTFKMGKTVCARRSTLRDWMAQQEAAAATAAAAAATAGTAGQDDGADDTPRMRRPPRTRGRR